MDKYIYEIDNVISKEVCKEIIELFNSMPNKNFGRVAAGIRPDIKKSIDYMIPFKDNKKSISDYELEMWEDITNLLIKSLGKHISIYFKDIYDIYDGPLFEEYFIDCLMMQRYTKNDGSYKIHTDNSVKIDENFKPIDRIVTFIFYINDIDEGGETELYKKIKIKPKSGKLLLFPACWTFPHSGNVPISDDKYIITGWFYKNNYMPNNN